MLHILQNKFLYIITLAVLLGGFLFKALNKKIIIAVQWALSHMSLELFVLLVIIILGLASSMITAIIAALILVEVINNMPLSRKGKINISIIACFAIGLGSALTPIGEPLSTIIVSKLQVDFFYLFNCIGVYVIPAVVILAVLGVWIASTDKGLQEEEKENNTSVEYNTDIVIRAVKVFAFIVALELIGAGFKPIIDNYIIKLDTKYIYWVNILSAVLDNATLASAEISLKMDQIQIRNILIGLLISGGMMIPGNIPNIITANKMNITSKQWMKLGMPLGLVALVIFYVLLF